MATTSDQVLSAVDVSATVAAAALEVVGAAVAMDVVDGVDLTSAKVSNTKVLAVVPTDLLSSQQSVDELSNDDSDKLRQKYEKPTIGLVKVSLGGLPHDVDPAAEFNRTDASPFEDVIDVKPGDEEIAQLDRFYGGSQTDDTDTPDDFNFSKIKAPDLVRSYAIPTYNMTYPKKGLFMLFNQMNFDRSTGMPSRPGTHSDAAKLDSLFRDLGFDVKRYEDRTGAQIMAALTEASKYKGNRDASCFVCAFLTHGRQENNEDVIYGCDTYIYTRDIYDLFKGDKCPSLAGKPKFFIVQACRGKDFDNGVYADCIDGMFEDVCGQTKKWRIPIEADFLYAYSTTPRYYSWRNEMKGSWFIQELVTVFRHYYKELDVLTMLTLVNNRVAYYHESNASGAMMKRQMPSVVSQLTQQFYLTSKTEQPADEKPQAEPIDQQEPAPKPAGVQGSVI